MRVALPSDNERTVAAHMGRCEGFVIYDIEPGRVDRVEYRPNTFTGHAKMRMENPEAAREAAAQSGYGHGHGMGPGHGVGGHGHGQGQHGGQGGHSHGGVLRGLGDCQMVVALGMGPRLQNDLKQHGIEVCYTRNKQIEEVVQQIAEGAFTSHPDGSACKNHH